MRQTTTCIKPFYSVVGAIARNRSRGHVKPHTPITFIVVRDASAARFSMLERNKKKPAEAGFFKVISAQ